jgi:tetratricopeptide (TPR) repeat protein
LFCIYDFCYWCYNYQASHESAISSISQAIRHRHRLSEFNDIETRILNYLIHGEEERVIKLLEFQNKLRPQDFNLLFTTLITYGKLHLLDRMEDVALRLNEVVPGHPPYQIWLARCYMLSGKPNKGLDVLNELLTDNPEHVEALLKIGEAYLHKNDLEAAEEVFNQAIFLMPEEERYWTKLLDHISYMRNIKDAQEVLESLEGIYRTDVGEQNSEFKIMQNQLFIKAENQNGLFIYPISDSVFVTAFKNGDTFDFLTTTFIRNSQGIVIQYKGEQGSGSDYSSWLAWK